MRKIVLAALFVTGFSVAAYAVDATVTQSHKTFDQEAVSVGVGSTVTFENKDDVTHNIQIVDAGGDVEDEGLQKPGQDIKHTFAKAGTYKVRCAIHPKMKMAVTVQ